MSAGQNDETRLKAINEAFELLSVNYNHLFFKAFEEKTAIIAAKRLWLEALIDFTPETIIRAIHHIIREFDFLPTLSRVIRTCHELSESAIPTCHSAYLEACNAPSPKASFDWSHPIVYHAGRSSDWFFLAHSNESIAYPVFKTHFEKLKSDIAQGVSLPVINPPKLTQTIETPLSRDENLKRLNEMKASLNLDDVE